MSFIQKHAFKVIGFVFFLFNSIGLPAPVLYSNIISIVGVKSYFNKKNRKTLAIFFLVSLAYLIIHVFSGVDLFEYMKTFLYMHVMVFTTLVSYNYIKSEIRQVEGLFVNLSYIVFSLFILSVGLYFTPFKEYLWVIHDFSIKGTVPRYKWFAYEPSYFALLMSPVFILFFLKTIYLDFKKNVFKLSMVLIPCIFTLSFGFFAILTISTILFLTIIVFKYRSLHSTFFYAALFMFLSCSVALSFDSFLSNRVEKILAGEDTSVNGRITESYYLANQMVVGEEKFFGIGLGQIEIIGEKYIRGYYGYSREEWPVMSLPNAMAETIAIYGYTGIVIRLLLIVFLFFKFKVYRNYFNLFLFIFLFFYQLMGSFITSSAELILWVLAILPIFKELDIKASPKFKLI